MIMLWYCTLLQSWLCGKLVYKKNFFGWKWNMKEGETVTALSDGICQDRTLILSGCDFLFNRKLGITNTEHTMPTCTACFHIGWQDMNICIQKCIITTCRADSRFCPNWRVYIYEVLKPYMSSIGYKVMLACSILYNMKDTY